MFIVRPSPPPEPAAWPPSTPRSSSTTAEGAVLSDIALPFLDRENPVFPHPETALTDPDGLLAAGGNLHPDTLVSAYRQGIFPWYEEGQPILWWSPATRAVLRPGSEHIGRTMAKVLARNAFLITTNTAFDQVIAACSGSRNNASGTWITPLMLSAYQRLHEAGIAQSLECWQQGKLVGGLYGLSIGAVFCGESMFSHVPNASKVAFVALSRALIRQRFALIDCQIPNPHLRSLGVDSLPRQDFLTLLQYHRSDNPPWPNNEDFAAALTMLVS